MPKRSGIQIFIDEATRAHRNVYENFRRKAVSENVAVTPALSGEYFSVGTSSAEHRDSVEIRSGVTIERLPYKRRDETSTARDPGIFVLMNSLEVFKFDGKPIPENSFLYKSNVRIGYYKRSKEKWQTLLCIRYDYQNARDAHPLFHAQLEEGPLSGDARHLFLNVPEIVGIPSLHTRVRMPSANVIGATAMLTLAADHLSAKTFQEMVAVLKSQPFFSNWRCDCSSLDDADSIKGLLSNGWYGVQ